MNPLNRHLTDDEIFLATGGGAPDDLLSPLLQHARDCEDCSRRLAREGEIRSEILGWVALNSPEKPSACPDLLQWTRYHGGELAAEDAAKLVEHCASCPICASKLNAVLTVDDGPLSPEEEAFLAGAREPLAIPQPKPQLKPTLVKSAPPRSTTRWQWIGAIAASLVVIGSLAGWWLWRSRQPGPVLALLAESASTHRPGDFRFPGARHSDPQNVRGSTGPSDPQQDEARLRIDRLAPEERDRPPWIAAEARLELLEWRYAAVIERLRTLGDRSGGALDLELGLAYLERADTEQQAVDYQNAIECFSRVLHSNPRDLDALFDRAIVYQRLTMFNQAAEDWRAYLKLDTQSDWGAEARKNLAFCEDKLKRQSSVWRNQSDEAASEDTGALLVRHEGVAPGEDHGDLWSADFARAAERTPNARRELAAAMRDNETGDAGEAERLARSACRRYQLGGHPAGELRAAFEVSYALQRESRGDECMQFLQDVVPAVMRHPYPWLQAQLLNQRCICALMTGSFVSAERDAAQAAAIAQRARYPNLWLRGVGLQASVLTRMGRYVEAAEADRRGLLAYWDGVYEPLRAQHFFYELMLGASHAGRWYAAQALALEAASAASLRKDHSFEAISRGRAAEFAARLGDKDAMRRQYERAMSLFNELPDNQTRQLYETFATLGIAEHEGTAGLARLAPIEGLLAALSNQTVAGRFLNVRAQLLAASGDSAGAENSWTRLVSLGQAQIRNRTSLDSQSAWQREMSTASRELVRLKASAGDIAGAGAVWETYLSAPALTGAAAADHFTTLVYVQHPQELLIFVRREDRSLRLARIAVRGTDLRRLISALTALAANPASDPHAIHSAGAKLYALLLQPVREWLAPDQPLVLITDGEIDAVPWNVLSLPDGRYLSEEITAVSLPEIAVPHPRTHLAALGFGPLVIASPAIGEGWAALLKPLPETRMEAESVTSHFPDATVLQGRAATLAAVRRSLSSATLLHFAGHAVQHGGGVSLILAPDDTAAVWEEAEGFWRPAQSNSRELANCSLAVFSACSTSLSDEGASGAQSLVHAFLAAGVPHVVATRWNINSQTTLLFMTQFYAYLSERGNVAQALRSAAELIRKNPRTAHPYYWAGFEAFGALDNGDWPRAGTADQRSE